MVRVGVCSCGGNFACVPLTTVVGETGCRLPCGPPVSAAPGCPCDSVSLLRTVAPAPRRCGSKRKSADRCPPRLTPGLAGALGKMKPVSSTNLFGAQLLFAVQSVVPRTSSTTRLVFMIFQRDLARPCVCLVGTEWAACAEIPAVAPQCWRRVCIAHYFRRSNVGTRCGKIARRRQVAALAYRVGRAAAWPQ